MALSLTCRRLLYRQQPSFLQCRQTGYIVMLPDVPAHTDDNPLLRSDKFQDFSALTPRKCYDGIARRALDFEAGFWKLEKHIQGKAGKTMTDVELFQEYLCPIEELSLPLENAYNVVKVTQQTSALMKPMQYEKIATRAALALENKFTSPLLYNSCKNALQNENINLKEDQKRLLKKYTTFGKLNGLELNVDDYNLLISVQKKTLKEQTIFNNKVETSTSRFKLQVSDPHVVKDFPPNLLQAMSDGIDPSRGPWTVRYRTMVPFLEYCPNALLREKVWEALVTFCLYDDDNITTTNVDIANIRYSRIQEAKILGFASYADYAMVTKMAGSVDNVLNMLDRLVQKARPAQAHEVESLNKYAFQNGFHKPLQFWDVGYWQRDQLRKSYGFNENDLSAYFPLETVLNGLFSLIHDIFGIEYREISGVETWHKDVRVFEVFDSNSKEPLAHIYLDAIMRSGKPFFGGAALTLRNRSLVGKGQSPQISLVFNFSPPVAGKPCLLSFSNVLDLFGRFGYALQVILSKAAYAEVAGSSYIELDAAQIPSDFMVQWAYNQSVVERISGHYETGEKLPASTFSNLDRARKHMAGFHLCNEIYKARLDQEFFATNIAWKTITDKLWPMYSAFPLDDRDHMPLSFYQIFNDRSASYYASLWSKVTAADIFTAFQEVGLENKEAIRGVGKRFCDIYLTGLHGAAENFRRFRGRDPSPDAFLLWQGLQKPLKSPQSK